MTNQVSILRIRLHTAIVGYLVGTRDGNNALIFSDEYVQDPNRPTFTLSRRPFPSKSKIMPGASTDFRSQVYR